MALTPEIRAPQGYVISGVRIAAHQLNAPEAYDITAVKFPSEELRASQGYITVGVRGVVSIDVSEAYVMYAVKGRVANPRLRAWTFSLDGHDFYVLRLGDQFGTLVYDTTTGQWVDWDSLNLPFWRANTGINWLGANRLAPDYGSNVLVGDDAWGLLWLLSPEQGYDEHPDYLNPAQQVMFERVVMGQYIKRGYDAEPVYSIDLMGSLGEPVLSGQSVLLEYSDNMGKTFKATKAIPVTTGDYNATLVWTSLGQVQTPGRLFRITDYGALPRIDDMEMNSDG